MKPDEAGIEIVEDLEALSRRAAEVIINRVGHTLQTRTSFTIALSGGSTPKRLYTLLADHESFRSRLPWEKLHFFWGDERHVAPDHPESNFRMTRDAMLSKVPVPPANIHALRTTNTDAGEVARAYEQELCNFFHLETGQLPRFDCVLLGMGPDGHTASLFPGSTALSEKNRLVVAGWIEKFQSYRITLTLPVLNNADLIVLLASGAEKAMTLKNVLEGTGPADQLPVQRIRPKRGELLWIVDRPAASRLSRTK